MTSIKKMVERMTSCIFQISPSSYFCYMYGHQYLTYLPQKFLSKLFFWKKYGLEIPYLPTIWTNVQNFVVFFGMLSLVFKYDNGWGSICTVQPPWPPGKRGRSCLMSFQIFKILLNWQFTSPDLDDKKLVRNYHVKRAL